MENDAKYFSIELRQFHNALLSLFPLALACRLKERKLEESVVGMHDELRLLGSHEHGDGAGVLVASPSQRYSPCVSEGTYPIIFAISPPDSSESPRRLVEVVGAICLPDLSVAMMGR